MTKKIQDQRQSGINKKPKFKSDPITFNTSTERNNSSNANTIEFIDRDKKEKVFYNAKMVSILGSELMKWALENPQATRLQKFFYSRGMNRATIKQLRDRFPEFKEDYDHAKDMLASRLFDGGLVRAYTEKLVSFVMPMYDEDWKEESNRVARLKEEQQAALATRPITIVMQDYKIEDTSVVNTSVEDKEKGKK